MDASEIQDRKSFEAWLQDKPPEWAQALAARCALRVAPLAWSVAVLSEDVLEKKHRENLTLLTFRANFISSAAHKYPADDMQSAATYAGDAADAADAADTAYAAHAAHAADAAAYVADAAYATDAATDAAHTAGYAAYAAYAADATHIAAIWEVIRVDCAWLEKYSQEKLINAASNVQALVNQPLWMKLAAPDTLPDWAKAKFHQFNKSDLAQTTNFGMITDWYRSVLQAKPSPFSKEAEIAIAKMSREDWGDNGEERDCVAVMDRVAKLAGWVREIPNSKILEAQESLPGNKWIIEENKFAITSVVFDSDYEAANNQNTLKALESLIRKLEKFAKSAENFDDIYGWDGFAEDYAFLKEAIESGETDLVNSIWEIYDRTLTLASYLQQDNDVRKANPTYSNAALSADHRRQLTDIVRSLAPFVRRFPSIQTEDENTANFLQAVSANLACELINLAGEHKVISDQDRALINSLLQAMERNGLPAEKAGVRGICSTRNLLVAAAFVASTVAQGGLQQSEIYEKTSNWLGDKVDIAIEIVADAPSDVQSLVVQMVEEIQRQKDEEGETISESIIASNPRKKPSS